MMKNIFILKTNTQTCAHTNTHILPRWTLPSVAMVIRSARLIQRNHKVEKEKEDRASKNRASSK